MHGGKLKTLIDEPLLCYLVALSVSGDGEGETAPENVNAVYKSLFDQIWRRVWGKEPVGPASAFENREDYEQLLEHVALTAWRSGEPRVASADAFEKLIDRTSVEDIWRRFQRNTEDREDGFTTLALTFFFRAKTAGERGFEFTHKSFGEYLAARGLLRFAEHQARNFNESRDANDFAKWQALTGAAELSRRDPGFYRRRMPPDDGRAPIGAARRPGKRHAPRRQGRFAGAS